MKCAIVYCRFRLLVSLIKIKGGITFSNTISGWRPAYQLPGIGKQVLKTAGLLSSQGYHAFMNCGGGKGLEARMNRHEGESEKVRQLTADLQQTALSLIKHSGTNHFRIRIEGLVPSVYITLGEGRSSYSADSVMFDGPQGAAPNAAQLTGQNPGQKPAQNPAQNPAPPQVHLAAHAPPHETAQRTPLFACFSRLRKALAA